jgi:hypothetical protein
MSYPVIQGQKVDGRSTSKHCWNADLIDFEGPLVSLYKDETGGDLLYSWVDCTKISNRWCIIPIGRKSLRDYLEQETTLREIYVRSDWVMIFNTGKSSRRSSLIKTVWESLPQSYLPTEDSYLTPEIATPDAARLAEEVSEEYFLGLNGDLYIDDISIIPKIYQQLYSFHYGLEHLERQAVRETVDRLGGRWTGGLSSVNLFTGLNTVTPSIHRAKVVEMRFASPGHIRLDLLPDLAERIETAANKLVNEADFIALEQFYSTVYSYFREHRISGFDDEHTIRTIDLPETVIQRLQEYVVLFFRLMEWNDYTARFSLLNIDAFHQLKVLLAYYRRLKRLRPYLQSGNLTLGSSPLEGHEDEGNEES